MGFKGFVKAVEVVRNCRNRLPAYSCTWTNKKAAKARNRRPGSAFHDWNEG